MLFTGHTIATVQLVYIIQSHKMQKLYSIE